jgi:hypothetical protein
MARIFNFSTWGLASWSCESPPWFCLSHYWVPYKYNWTPMERYEKILSRFLTVTGRNVWNVFVRLVIS